MDLPQHYRNRSHVHTHAKAERGYWALSSLPAALKGPPRDAIWAATSNSNLEPRSSEQSKPRRDVQAVLSLCFSAFSPGEGRAVEGGHRRPGFHPRPGAWIWQEQLGGSHHQKSQRNPTGRTPSAAPRHAGEPHAGTPSELLHEPPPCSPGGPGPSSSSSRSSRSSSP